MGRDTVVRDSYQRFTEQFRSAVAAAGRKAAEIAVVAVSKTRSVEEIKAVVGCGARMIGENRIQEAREKFGPDAELSERAFELHMIGHLQRNKAKTAVELFDLIHSVDSIRIAEAIAAEAERLGKRQRVLIEVNSSGEEQKYGFPPERVVDAAAEISGLRHLELAGLMTVGPLTDDEREIRRAFAATYRLFMQVRDALQQPEGFRELSMGMSGDYEIAIAEGSTMVRIGTAIFGPRSQVTKDGTL